LTGHKDTARDLAKMRIDVLNMLEPLGKPGAPEGNNRNPQGLNQHSGEDKRYNYNVCPPETPRIQSIGGGGGEIQIFFGYRRLVKERRYNSVVHPSHQQTDCNLLCA